MNIDDRNFWEVLPQVKEVIRKCDFLAFDTEFSGLQLSKDNYFTRYDDIEDTYQKVIQTCMNFSVMQFGLATFKWDEASNAYKSTAFNFYLHKKETIDYPYVQLVQNKCYSFLSENHMDFERVFLHGISFERMSDLNKIKNLTIKKKDRQAVKTFLSAETTASIKDMTEQVESYLRDPVESSLVLDCRNTVLYQKFKKKGFLATWFDVDISNFPVENVKDKEHHLKFTKPKKFDYELLRGKSKDENMMVEESKTNGFTPSSDEEILGFSLVVNEIIATKKAIIGHNLMFDLGFIIEQFVQPLPDTYQGLHNLLTVTFPVIFDTKMVAQDIQPYVRVETNLEALHRYCFTSDKCLKPFCHVELEQVPTTAKQCYMRQDLMRMPQVDGPQDATNPELGSAFIAMLGFLDYAMKDTGDKEPQKAKKVKIKDIENVEARRISLETANRYQNMVAHPLQRTWAFENPSFDILKHKEERTQKYQSCVLYVKFDAQATNLDKLGNHLSQFGDIDMLANSGDEVYVEFKRFTSKMQEQANTASPIAIAANSVNSDLTLNAKCLEFGARKRFLASRLIPLS